MPSTPERSTSRSADLPLVDRPSFHIWQPLEAESIQWEGQVLIVGGVVDMPALLAATSERLALIANGQIMLDFPRSWLRPQPALAAANGVRLFINPVGVPGDAHPVLLRVREGRGAAVELVAVLTGRPLPKTPDAGGVLIPNWKDTVGAAKAVALPALDDEDMGGERRAPESWPPQESAAIAPMPPPQQTAQAPFRTTDRPMQTLADRRRAMAEPTPVPASVSRAARKQGTRDDGVTVRDDDGHRMAPVPVTRRSAVGPWLATAAMVLLLAAGFGYVAHDKYGWTFADVQERIPATIQERLGLVNNDEELALNEAPEAIEQGRGTTGDGTSGSGSGEASKPEVAVAEPTDEPVAAVQPTAEPTQAETAQDPQPVDPTAGVGGATTELPETVDVVPTQEIQDPTAPIETVAPTEEPVVVEPTAEPTEEPVIVEPTAAPTEEPPLAPTEEPTVAPTVEPTLEPTEAATEEPTIAPTEEATQAPTEEPTIAPTEEATEAPTEAPTAPGQEASVLPETTPEQAVVADGFRYTIEGASVGATVPELPEINSVAGYGQWVVLDVYAQNMSGEKQVFEMTDFVLYADGAELQLDSGTAWVNGLMGNVPAYGPTDAIQWAPGESHMVTLVFLAPADVTSLVLQAGSELIDVSPAIENPAPLMSEGPRIESDLLQGTVVDVIDGETIVVEIDGVQTTVRYLSLDVPTGDACYAGEATEANRALVSGQTVTIERQSTDADARGNLVRDVWVSNDAGQPVLVSQQLIAEGAAQADISEPNTRFAGWLQQTEAEAEAQGAGLWSACGQ